MNDTTGQSRTETKRPEHRSKWWWEISIRSLGSFTQDEKVKAFDELYSHARFHLEKYAETGYESKGSDLYEDVWPKCMGGVGNHQVVAGGETPFPPRC